jgi:ornithine lipid ester-linked acyl 2-hydroxylase
MSKHWNYPIEKPWFAYMGGQYSGQLPAWFNTEDFGWVQETESSFENFRVDLEKYLDSLHDKIEPYFLKDITSREGSWRMRTFYLWGQRNDDSCNAAPEVEVFFKNIPGMVSASVSILEGDAEISGHYGDSNTVVRGHLGIRIPGGLPHCAMEVGGEARAWEEGKWLLFCDAHFHRAWNRTGRSRYIVMMDVIQPHFLNQQKNICANALSLIRLQQVENKISLVKKLPGFMRGIIRNWIKLGIYLGVNKISTHK